MQLDADFISKVLGGIHTQSALFLQDSLFSVDTRTLQKGDVFVALKGARVDGHDYLKEALQKDASGFILSNDKKESILHTYGKELSNKYVLFVDDTLKALVDLARSWRNQFTYPVIGITGSVGKTTTKEMVRNILKLTDLPHIVSFGNQNSLIGVSLNLLRMRAHHKVAVFEMGISKRGGMKDLAALVRPTYAVIIKVGHSHMAGLGDINSIAQEKRNIFSCFSDQDVGVVNGDQVELSDVSYPHPIIRFGCKTTNQIQARKIVVANNTISFVAKIYNQRYTVVLPGCLEGLVTNALAAITIGYILKIPNEILIKGVEQLVTVTGRFQVLPHSSGSVLIHDAYNSSPDSAKASLLAFNAYQTEKQKVVVLGDMLELGIDSVFWHRQLGRFLRKVSGLQQVILVGKEVEATKKTIPLGIKVKLFSTADESFDYLKDILLQKDKVILFKGSNGVKIADLVEKLRDI